MRTKDRYARLAGRFWRHPKAVACSDAGLALWTRALSYVVDQMTDGHVSRAVAAQLTKGKPDKAAADLVALKLWTIHPTDGWLFHDYDDHNITRNDWEKEAERNRNKTNASRARNQEPTTNVTTSVTGNTIGKGDGNSLDAGRRTQDADAESATALTVRDRAASFWASSFRAARSGVEPRRDERSLLELVRLANANAPTAGREPVALIEALVVEYWRDPWTRERTNRPSLANLLTRHDALLGKLYAPAAVARGRAFDPTADQPQTPDEERLQAAWIADGCPKARRSA